MATPRVPPAADYEILEDAALESALLITMQPATGSTSGRVYLGDVAEVRRLSYNTVALFSWSAIPARLVDHGQDVANVDLLSTRIRGTALSSRGTLTELVLPRKFELNAQLLGFRGRYCCKSTTWSASSWLGCWLHRSHSFGPGITW